MIKISIMYPNTPGGRFDHAYYRDHHMPMLQRLLGETCIKYSIDQGIAGAAPGSAAPYIGMGHVYCESIERFQAALAPHAREIFADLANYTDLKPVMQFSEVVLGD